MHLTRRGALASAGLGLLAACTSGRRATPAPTVDLDEVLASAARVREQELLTAYDEVLAALPTLSARLGPLRADHAAHLVALGGTVATPAPSAAAPPARTAPAALLQLRSLEHNAAAAHATAAVTASRRLAAVLASLAAGEASHGVVL